MTTTVYYQDQVWIDREGARHEIAKMNQDYLQNVIAFLRNRAVTIALAESIKMLRYVDDEMTGDMAAMSLEQQSWEMLDHPHRWLESTKLMKALVAQEKINQDRANHVRWGQ